MAYIDELLDAGGTVVLHPRDEAPRPDVRRLLEGMGAADVYCCGPEGLMETVEEAGRSNPDLHVKVERFVPRPVGEERGFDGFEVVFEYSGLHASVDAGTSILSAAAAAGIDVPSSCEEGTCGTCETPVIEGEVVHLDSVLSDAERDASATMMICVSRANCPRLVLDL